MRTACTLLRLNSSNHPHQNFLTQLLLLDYSHCSTMTALAARWLGEPCIIFKRSSVEPFCHFLPSVCYHLSCPYWNDLRATQPVIGLGYEDEPLDKWALWQISWRWILWYVSEVDPGFSKGGRGSGVWGGVIHFCTGVGVLRGAWPSPQKIFIPQNASFVYFHMLLNEV